MSQMMLYVVPLLLGRTFDLDQLQVGVDIFAKDQISNPIVIENPITETHYKIVDNSKEARNLLDASGSFSLKVKSGLFKVGASGAYLTDVYNRENTVEVMVKATFQTVTETLPHDARPIATWNSMTALGTHYVRSVTYGGELLASFRLISNNTREKQKIKAGLEVGGRIKIFDVGVEVEGEYFKDIASSVDKMDIKIYSSIPLNKIPHDMDALKVMLKNFPEDMKQYNDGKGVPVKVELWPLAYFNSTRKMHTKNKALEAHLDNFEQKFDDLLNTKAAINDWMKVMTESLTEEEENKVGKFYAEVLRTLRSFHTVIGKLDMSQGLDQLQPALTAYGKNIPGNYYHRYLKLRQEMVNDQGAWTKHRGSGATYIHWGKSNCKNETETLTTGYVVGPGFTGGGFNFLCLPNEPNLGAETSTINVAELKNISYKLANREESRVLCSSCRLASKGSVNTFSGMTQCPSDWELMYKGVLMSGSGDNIYTSFLCLESEPDFEIMQSSQSPLVPNEAIIGGLETEQKSFSCVVCAK